MTLRAGIFGYPLGHSISPAFQQAAFDHLGIDAIYEAWETPPEKLGHAVASLRSGDFMGANVTVPHKQAVQQHLDTIEPLAAPQIPAAWSQRATGPRGSCRVTLAPGEYKISTVLDSGPASSTILIFPQQSTRLRLP